jgi:hypothetical protein
MKRNITSSICVLLFAVLFQAHADESNNLQIVLTQVTEFGQEEVQGYVYKTKTYEPMISYKYRFYCLLKNVGDVDVTVATKNLSPGFMRENDEDVPRAFLKFDKTSYNGSLIVPSEADLGLVVLRPGESAAIQWEKSRLNKRLNKVKVQYNPTDPFDNRFGYWTGSVTGDTAEVIVPKK